MFLNRLVQKLLLQVLYFSRNHKLVVFPSEKPFVPLEFKMTKINKKILYRISVLIGPPKNHVHVNKAIGKKGKSG